MFYIKDQENNFNTNARSFSIQDIRFGRIDSFLTHKFQDVDHQMVSLNLFPLPQVEENGFLFTENEIIQNTIVPFSCISKPLIVGKDQRQFFVLL